MDAKGSRYKDEGVPKELFVGEAADEEGVVSRGSFLANARAKQWDLSL